MSRRTLTWASIAAVLAVLVLVLVPAAAMAKKPGGDDPPEEPPADPAIAYRLMNGTENKLMVMNADGSNQTTVVDVGSAKLTRADWSPDGTQLVFGSDKDGVKGIYMVNVDGTGLHRIVTTDRVSPPVWSPKAVPGAGKGDFRIAYQEKDEPYSTWEVDLVLVKTDGTDPVLIEDFPDDTSDVLTWSPDGTKLVFAEMNTRALYCVLEFGEFGDADYEYTHHQFTGTMAEERLYALSWAKTPENSDKILFHIITGSFPNYGRDIYLLDLATPTTATEITSQRGMEMFPNFSPDDTKIVFELTARKKRSPTKIAVMDADGTNITTIQTGGSQPTWKR